MDDRYERHCFADPLFYDDPARAEHADDRFAAATAPLPPGWERHEHGPWISLRPPHARLPEQGWKVHVSATPDEAEQVVDQVLAYCLEHGLTWKFLRGRATVLALNSKYADRRASGKLITLYPEDDTRLARVLDDLSTLLKGVPGPYVLSDLRYREGPLYLRYGSFVERHCTDERGRRVPAMRGPDGALVPDTRGTVFTVPDWAPVPDLVSAQLAADAAREAEAPADFPFEVVKALHFSNGGGIYQATDRRDGRQVVLREARPHAGLDYAGRDAVQRLLSERRVLEALAGVDFVPALYEYRQVWEHHYLVEEYIEGERLEDVFTRTCPLTHPDPDEAELAAYTDWALDVLDQVGGMLAALHERGLVFGDLHPNNVMVRPDGRCALVDFEIAFPADDPAAPPLGAPGFVSPKARRGTAVDAYALAALRLYLFLPLNIQLGLDSGKAELAGREISRRYPVPAGFGAGVAEALHRAAGGKLPAGATERAPGAADGAAGPARPAWPQEPSADTAAWRPVLDSLAAGILAMATPDRTDRLFPGDVEQFGPGHGGLGLSYGAAGVLYALRACGRPAPPEHTDWLVARADAAADLPPGLYDGLTGIAWTLARLGATREADTLVERLLATEAPADPGLGSGRAGIALGLLDLADVLGRERLADRALALGHGLARDEPAPRLRGLLDGWSGQAALFLRLYGHTGERRWLTAAETALGRELDEADVTDGMLFLVEDRHRRKLPYLAAGGVGTARLISELARHSGADRPDGAGRLPGRFAQATAAADRACLPDLIAAAGLFEGRAGLVLHLLRGGRGAEADRHLRLLEWHVMNHRGHLAFPGRRSMRLSADLATGAAGVLVALHEAVLGPVPLPGITDFPGPEASRP
ncbi:class III lanthionine synthetase LanKC [Kitasatospora sp. SC0581]|uniref:class III lanthionine synthetase LanKC n=1 Tax=Kitasatospora sp. SC0581 TaxID=3394360 RepID=UPI003A839774